MTALLDPVNKHWPTVFKTLRKNCGTGAGGFQPGNDCAKEGGNSGGDTATDERQPRLPGMEDTRPKGIDRQRKEILEHAKQIEFSDERYHPSVGVDRTDYDEIEEALSTHEKDDMQEYIDRERDAYIESYTSGTDISDYIDEGEVANDAGYGRTAINEGVKEIVAQYLGEGVAETFSSNVPSHSVRGVGLDRIDNWLEKVKAEVGLSGELKDALNEYRNDAEAKIQSSREDHELSALEGLSESASESFDSEEARREFLKQWYDKHSMLFNVANDTANKWMTTSGGRAYAFKLSDGRGFEITADKARPNSLGGKEVHNIAFTDEGGDTTITGKGKAFEVFSNVVPAVTSYVQHEKPDAMTFQAHDASRQKLYNRLVSTVLGVNSDYFAKYYDSGGWRNYVVAHKSLREEMDRISESKGIATEEIAVRRSLSADKPEWHEIPAEIDPAWFTPEGWEEEPEDDKPVDPVNKHWRAMLSRIKSLSSLRKNCGTGAGGFQPGNDCAKESGGGGEEKADSSGHKADSGKGDAKATGAVAHKDNPKIHDKGEAPTKDTLSHFDEYDSSYPQLTDDDAINAVVKEFKLNGAAVHQISSDRYGPQSGHTVSDDMAVAIKIVNVNEISTKMQSLPAEKVTAFVDDFRYDRGGAIANKSEHQSVGHDPHKKAASYLQDLWASTSGDNNKWAQAVQLVAKEHFGIDNAYDPMPKESKYGEDLGDVVSLKPVPSGEISKRTREIVEKHKDVISGFLQATYDHTQERLKELGVERITLYRGMSADKMPIADEPRDEEGRAFLSKEPIQLQPLSSFAHTFSSAWDFATGNSNDNSLVIAVNVPREKIFSTALTGPGCANEHELIVIGGHVEARAMISKSIGESYKITTDEFWGGKPNAGQLAHRPHLKSLRKSDCGANAEGGGGFQPGNTCGKEDGGGSKEESSGEKTSKQREAVRYYTDESNDINIPLREKGPDGLTGKAKEVYDTLQPLASKPLQKPITVYRGVQLPTEIEDSLTPGAVVKFDGLTSSSLDLDEAKVFGRRGVMLEIEAKTGLLVGDDAAKYSENQKELIQAHGTSYKVVGEVEHSLPGHRRMFRLEEVGNPSHADAKIQSELETLGMKRHDLPQIAGVDKPDFLKELKAKGVDYKERSIAVKDLKGVQGEYDPERVGELRDAIGKGDKEFSRPLVSSDGYIIDGHHRWRGQYEHDKDSKLDVIQIDLPVHDLLKEVRESPKAFTANINEVPGKRSPIAGHERRNFAALLSKISQPDGGFTYQPVTEEIPKTGYALSPYPERSFAKHIDKIQPEDLWDYVQKNGDVLAEQKHYFGGWHDPATGNVFLDISIVTQDEKEAAQLALDKDQIAYFDLVKMASVTVNRNATSGGAAKNLPTRTIRGTIDVVNQHWRTVLKSLKRLYDVR